MHKCDAVKALLALGFEVVDACNLAEGYNSGVRYYNFHLNEILNEYGV